MTEAAQPSMKSMALVKNRNNISDIFLARQIKNFERERSMTILNIDHDRLDMKDFLRDIKKCESDDLPEARHWLGQGRRKKKSKEMETVRSIATAPTSRTSNPEKERNIKTAPEQQQQKQDRKMSGMFKRRDTDTTAQLAMYNIFSRRAQLVDTGPIWQDSPLPEEEEPEVKFGSTDAIEAVAAENHMGSQHNNVDILVLGSKGKEHKHCRITHGHSEGASGDFMKDLLVDNAKKKYKKKKGKPIQERLTAFYSKLDELKHQEEDDVPSAREMRQRYILLTQGVKAALEYSRDDDDDHITH